MTRKHKMHTSGCPLAFALDIFGDRWSFLILREMMLRGKKTYSEFLEIDEGIATNILADRLKHLETDGLIRKTRDPENRRSFIYTLTNKGRDLAPVIIEMILWSGKHDQRPSALRATVEKISKDRHSFEADIRSR